jgi:hypothetical protein
VLAAIPDLLARALAEPPVRGALAVALASRAEPHEYADSILNDLFSAVHRVS